MNGFPEISAITAPQPRQQAENAEVAHWNQNGRNWTLLASVILLIGGAIGTYFGATGSNDVLLGLSIGAGGVGGAGLILARYLHNRNIQRLLREFGTGNVEIPLKFPADYFSHFVWLQTEGARGIDEAFLEKYVAQAGSIPMPIAEVVALHKDLHFLLMENKDDPEACAILQLILTDINAVLNECCGKAAAEQLLRSLQPRSIPPRGDPLDEIPVDGPLVNGDDQLLFDDDDDLPAPYQRPTATEPLE